MDIKLLQLLSHRAGLSHVENLSATLWSKACARTPMHFNELVHCQNDTISHKEHVAEVKLAKGQVFRHARSNIYTWIYMSLRQEPLLSLVVKISSQLPSGLHEMSSCFAVCPHYRQEYSCGLTFAIQSVSCVCKLLAESIFIQLRLQTFRDLKLHNKTPRWKRLFCGFFV